MRSHKFELVGIQEGGIQEGDPVGSSGIISSWRIRLVKPAWWIKECEWTEIEMDFRWPLTSRNWSGWTPTTGASVCAPSTVSDTRSATSRFLSPSSLAGNPPTPSHHSKNPPPPHDHSTSVNFNETPSYCLVGSPLKFASSWWRGSLLC